MKTSKRAVYGLIATLLAGVCILPTAGCKQNNNVIELNVYNWEDYVSDYDEEWETVDLISEFEDFASNYYTQKEGREMVVKVNYSTFGTNENMYNELQLSKTSHKKDGKTYYTYNYDLVCPSDYMIQKMIKDGMLEEYDVETDGSYTNMPNYTDYASGFIKNLFGKNGWNKYAVCYMWGTMGFVYNPDIVKSEDALRWTLPWNLYYKNLGTIKDSVRDTYALAVGYVYSDLMYTEEEGKTALNTLLNDGVISQTTFSNVLLRLFNNIDKPLSQEMQELYQSENADDTIPQNQKMTALGLEELKKLFSNVSESTVSATGKALKDLKKNVYGFEVDSGKRDMASGKIAINFAWSGDATYTLDLAEEDDVYLHYEVPKEGSNIWFDGWVMPKGANKELAQMFVNFISSPDMAISNMDYIGYNSAIAGDDMFARMLDYYDLTLTPDEDHPVMIDYSYYFTNLEEYQSAVVYSSEDNIGRQLTAQYPQKDVVDRCAIMLNFTKSDNKKLNAMWSDIKVGYIPTSLIIAIPAVLIGIGAIYATMLILKKKGIKIAAKKKDYGKLISSEQIK